MDIEGFGKRVRYLRTLAKLTQAQTAEKLGVTPEHLGNIERGVSVPSFELIYRIANVLNTEPFNLFLSTRKSSEESCENEEDNSWSSFISGMGAWEYDLKSGEMYWSDSLFRLFGVSAREVTPSIELMLERVHPNDLERVREKWANLYKGQVILPTKFRIRNNGGEYRTIVNYGEFHKKRSVILGFNIDITENCILLDAFRELQNIVEEETAGRTRSLNDMVLVLASAMQRKEDAQTELENRETLFRSFVENIQDIFFVMEPGEGFTYVSPASEELLGVSAPEIIQDINAFYAVVHPEDQDLVRAMHERRFRGESAGCVYRVILKDGKVRRMRSRSFTLPGAHSDSPLKVVGITEDVTDVHNAESARERAEELLEQVLSAVGDAVCIVDMDRNVLRANEDMVRLFHTDELIVGRKLEDLLKQDLSAGVLGPLAEYCGELTVLEHTMPDGETRILELHEFPHIRDCGVQDGAVVVLRDQTEKMRAIQTLEQTCDEKSRYLTYLSHEIRTPLNGILGLLQLIKMEQGDEMNEYVDAALASGAILTDLVNGVLDLSRLESGRMEMREKEFDPCDLVQSVLCQFQYLADMKTLTLGVEYNESLPQVLMGDAKRIRQILSNLLGNAIKFTETGGVSVYVGVVRNGEPSIPPALKGKDSDTSAKLRITVQDTGEGIPPEKLPCIFDEYVQAGCSRRSEQGYGLGLAITKRLLRAIGGDIQVESEPGKGSSFTCLIPVHSGDPSNSL